MSGLEKTTCLRACRALNAVMGLSASDIQLSDSLPPNIRPPRSKVLGVCLYMLSGQNLSAPRRNYHGRQQVEASVEADCLKDPTFCIRGSVIESAVLVISLG